jgi:hypothetical protein
MDAVNVRGVDVLDSTQDDLRNDVGLREHDHIDPSNSVTVAPVRSAIERTTSVPAALSPIATTAQPGKVLQVGVRWARRMPAQRRAAG